MLSQSQDADAASCDWSVVLIKTEYWAKSNEDDAHVYVNSILVEMDYV